MPVAQGNGPFTSRSLNRFMTKSRNPLPFTVDALVIPCTLVILVFAFSPLKPFSQRLYKIEGKWTPVILIAQNWPVRTYGTQTLDSLVTCFGLFQTDLTSCHKAPPYHPA